MTDYTDNYDLPIPVFDTDPWHLFWTEAMGKIDLALFNVSTLGSFDGLYLGAFATDPVLDNAGNALVTGALYFKTTDDKMRSYNGAAWVVAFAPTTGFYTTSETDDLLDLKADLVSPTFTGHPLGVTEAPGTNNTRLATTAFVKAESVVAAQMPALTGDVTTVAGAVVATLANSAVSNAKFRQSSGLAVVGRSANSTGDVADIVAANDGEILRRSGTAIGFGGISADQLTSGTVVAARLAIMTTAQYWANTASKIVSTDQVWAAGALVALTDATTIAVDMSTGLNFSVTLGGNRTLGAPSSPKVGQSGSFVVTQDGTGSRTLAYHANFDFASGTAPTLSLSAAAVDILFYWVRSATSIVITGILKSIT